jgi:hypothetical protein
MEDRTLVVLYMKFHATRDDSQEATEETETEQKTAMPIYALCFTRRPKPK